MKIPPNCGYRVCKGDELHRLVKQRFGTIRRFAKKVNMSDGMVSYILHGRRRLYPWNMDIFVRVLDIKPDQMDLYFGGNDAGDS